MVSLCIVLGNHYLLKSWKKITHGCNRNNSMLTKLKLNIKAQVLRSWLKIWQSLMSETLGIFLQYTNEQHEVAMLNQETTVWPVLLLHLREKFTLKWKIVHLSSCSFRLFFFYKSTLFLFWRVWYLICNGCYFSFWHNIKQPNHCNTITQNNNKDNIMFAFVKWLVFAPLFNPPKKHVVLTFALIKWLLFAPLFNGQKSMS